MNLLDFEKPIAELESKLTDMKQLADDSDESVNKAIQALENKIVELKKETFERTADMANGWVLAKYQGFNLGWLKVLPNRLNYYLPPERRIRMELGQG